MSRYADHSRRFEEVASRRRNRHGRGGHSVPRPAPRAGAGADDARDRGAPADLGMASSIARSASACSLGGDGQVPRPAPSCEAPVALARACRRRRLSPRHHRLAPQGAFALRGRPKLALWASPWTACRQPRPGRYRSAGAKQPAGREISRFSDCPQSCGNPPFRGMPTDCGKTDGVSALPAF